MFPRESVGRANAALNLLHIGAAFVIQTGIGLPDNPTRKRMHPFDARTYRQRNVIERTFSRLKDFRRIATRYDKLASNFLAAVAFASIISYWL